MACGRAGFTLLELLIVVFIIGILAAFALPQHLRTVETAKADDGVALLTAVASANRLYALAHGTYAKGVISSTCGTVGVAGAPPCCPGANNGGVSCTATATDPCDLVQCKYLSAQDFNSKPYIAAADDPTTNTVCSTASLLTQTGNGNLLACIARKTSSNDSALTAPPAVTTGETAYTPYTTWGYGISTTGQIYSVGTNPPPAVQP